MCICFDICNSAYHKENLMTFKLSLSSFNLLPKCSSELIPTNSTFFLCEILHNKLLKLCVFSVFIVIKRDEVHRSAHTYTCSENRFKWQKVMHFLFYRCLPRENEHPFRTAGSAPQNSTYLSTDYHVRMSGTKKNQLKSLNNYSVLLYIKHPIN